MSQIIVATLVNLLATVLPLIGIQIGSDALTNTIQTVVAIVTGIVIYVRRVQMGGALAAPVTLAGVKK